MSQLPVKYFSRFSQHKVTTWTADKLDFDSFYTATHSLSFPTTFLSGGDWGLFSWGYSGRDVKLTAYSTEVTLYLRGLVFNYTFKVQ